MKLAISAQLIKANNIGSLVADEGNLLLSFTSVFFSDEAWVTSRQTPGRREELKTAGLQTFSNPKEKSKACSWRVNLSGT